MAIRRTATLGLAFSVATGVLLFATEDPAHASSATPQHANCIPWPYRPCPPGPPGPPGRDRDHHHGGYEEFESYEEYLDYTERRRTHDREATPPEVHRVTAPVQPRFQREELPRTGAEVLTLALGGLILVSAGAVVVAGRRRGRSSY